MPRAIEFLAQGVIARRDIGVRLEQLPAGFNQCVTFGHQAVVQINEIEVAVRNDKTLIRCVQEYRPGAGEGFNQPTPWAQRGPDPIYQAILAPGPLQKRLQARADRSSSGVWELMLSAWISCGIRSATA